MSQSSVKATILAQIREEGCIRHLHLEETMVDELPDVLWEQPLESLLLESVGFTNAFPQKIFQLTTLKHLAIGSVAIKTKDYWDEEKYLEVLPEAIANLTNLEVLELWDNNLQALPDLSGLSKLRELTLSGNKQLDLSACELPPGITDLDIGCMDLESIPKNICSLPLLQELYFNNNQLSELPDTIARLSKLEKLVLDHNPLPAFPEKLTSLPALKSLKLTGCKIKKWPNTITGFDNLAHLHVGHNALKRIGKSIHELKNLQTLDASNNELISIDPAINRLKNLTLLRVKKNQLTSLTDLGELTSLQHLDISYNKIQSLPRSVYALENLESLTCTHNQLGQLLSGISNLEKLHTLQVSHCQLLFLPDDLGQVTSLQSCDLSYNPIKKLPDLTPLRQLTYIGLSGMKELEDAENQLLQLSELKSLKEISLQDTPVVSFIPELKKLPHLHRINLGFPQLSDKDKELIKEVMHPVTVWIKNYRKY